MIKRLAFPALYASGFIVLVLGYPPSPMILIIGGGLCLAGYLAGYFDMREASSRQPGLDAKGPGEKVETSPAKPSIGLQLKRRLEEE